MSWSILIALLAALGSCLVSSLHFALRDFSVRRLEKLAKDNGGMRKLERIVEDPESHAMSLGAVRVVLHIVLVIAMLYIFGIAPKTAGGEVTWSLVRVTVAAALSVVLVYVFGLLIPTSVAQHAGERMIHSFSWLIRGTHVLAAPLHALRFVDEAVKRLAGAHHVTEKEELEGEILDVVEEGQREGSLGEMERDMIESVVELAGTTIEGIMTPRTEMEGLELTNDLAPIIEFIERAGHSRIPVWEGDPDHIVGILYVKDLLRFVGRDAAGFELKPLLRAALFVPESKPVLELLVELQAKKIHMAIVLDEYGGTAGLVTLEDILEEVVGEIEDEYEPKDEAPPEIVVDEASRSAVVDGRMYIRDANEALEAIEVEIPEHEDYDTVGGYVLAVLGHIPQAGETFFEGGRVVHVLEAEPTRVNKLRIEAQREEEKEIIEGALEEVAAEDAAEGIAGSGAAEEEREREGAREGGEREATSDKR